MASYLNFLNTMACEPFGEAQLTQVVEQRRYASQPIKHVRAETGKFSEIVVSWDFFSIFVSLK
jgi:hypothetical protein